MKSWGRLDYMPRLKCWKVIGYLGRKDIEIGRGFSDRETALQVLSDWRKENPHAGVKGRASQ